MLIERLLSFYKEDPKDPFNVYALAIEYQKTDADAAGHYFGILLEEHPDYLPTYYQAASFMVQKNDLAKAALIYEKGIALASTQNNAKVLRELRGAYQLFRDEFED